MSPSRLSGLLSLAEAVPGWASRGLRAEAALELLVELLLRECGPGAVRGLRARPGRCQATQHTPHLVEEPGPPGPQEPWVGDSAPTSDTARRRATVVSHPAVVTFVNYNSFPGKRFLVLRIKYKDCIELTVSHNAITYCNFRTKRVDKRAIAHVVRVP